MNKETKIGLLVGLSFIVLFGVILSGRAPDGPSTLERTMVSQTPHKRTDNVQVVRPIELPKQPPVPIGVLTETAGRGTIGETATVPTDSPIAVIPAEPAPVELTGTPNTQPDQRPAGSQMADAAGAAPTEPVEPAEAKPKMAEYTVKKGDSLYKIASTVYGDASSKTVEMIYEANRDTLPNKRTLFAGKTIRLPVPQKDHDTKALLESGKFQEMPVKQNVGPQGEASLSGDPGDTPEAAPNDQHEASPSNSITSDPRQALAELLETNGPKAAAVRADEEQGSASADTGKMRHYQVQKGDTWYRMAAKFMGDGSRWKELYALNDDIAPDVKKLRTGIKIRVPVN